MANKPLAWVTVLTPSPSAGNIWFWQEIQQHINARSGRTASSALGEARLGYIRSIDQKRLPGTATFFNFSCIPSKRLFQIKFHSAEN
jgi:hypothetical protein